MEEKGTNTEQEYVLATDVKTAAVAASDFPDVEKKGEYNPPPLHQNGVVTPGEGATLPLEMHVAAPKKQGHKCK